MCKYLQNSVFSDLNLIWENISGQTDVDAWQFALFREWWVGVKTSEGKAPNV